MYRLCFVRNYPCIYESNIDLFVIPIRMVMVASQTFVGRGVMLVLEVIWTSDVTVVGEVVVACKMIAICTTAAVVEKIVM
jgi:hypothetical protein